MSALVAYSDSEGSDDETTVAPVAPVAPTGVGSTRSKPAFSKISEPRKIKVDVPTLRSEPRQHGDAAEQPPAKRARTAGAFGGFNSLLPAPKRAAAPQLKKGVNLKTSSEAAFSRAAPAPMSDDHGTGGSGDYDEFGNRTATGPSTSTATAEKTEKSGEEVKIIAKATKFRPLSVTNNKKKKKVVKKAAPASETQVMREPKQDTVSMIAVELPLTKPKRSLFSLSHQDELLPLDAASERFETFTDSEKRTAATTAAAEPLPTQVSMPANAPAGSLEAVASDLNLTAAQRRQLFGRGGGNAQVAHFSMDNEYAANEQIRQSGETVEHRAVKSIAPGKHSLQQLVNNARSNQESIEDKWAEGRRNQGGSRYGW